MSETHDAGEFEFAPTLPFRLICAGCGADADAPDQFFRTGHPALVPHSSHLLLSVRCLGCQTDHDLTLGSVDHQSMISDSAPQDLEALAEAAEAEGLPDRYRDLVDRYRRQVEAQYEQADAWPEVDLSRCEIDLTADRLSRAPMEVLAASRALRQVVACRPGLLPPSVILLGPYRGVVSFDRTPEAPHPWALHVSLGTSQIAGQLTDQELGWLTSLFFTPGEVPFLLARPGQAEPVVHFFLPAYEQELNPS